MKTSEILPFRTLVIIPDSYLTGENSWMQGGKPRTACDIIGENAIFTTGHSPLSIPVKELTAYAKDYFEIDEKTGMVYYGSAFANNDRLHDLACAYLRNNIAEPEASTVTLWLKPDNKVKIRAKCYDDKYHTVTITLDTLRNTVNKQYAQQEPEIDNTKLGADGIAMMYGLEE
jgi:hypothetical protein